MSRQRLIYAGHCLEDAQTLEVVLRGRSASNVTKRDGSSAQPATTQVIHLVCFSREQLSNTGGVRLRKTATARSAPVAEMTPPLQPAVPANVAAPPAGATFQYGNAFYGYPPPQQAQQQPPQNAYEAYAASYQN